MGNVIIDLSKRSVRALIKRRDPHAHKGDFGKVLLICGSVGYTGAPTLAALAAVRTGGGLVFVGVPEAIYPIVAGALHAPMVFPLPCDASGRLTAEALPPLFSRMNEMNAIAIGPGLGRSSGVTALVCALIREATVPVVLDADGINAIVGHIDVLRETACPIILTPHDGEFRRLHELSDNRLDCAARLARETGCICLLKGHPTLITDGENMRRSRTGNPGMAVGGSGDVLTGMIASLLGQGLSPLDAACAGAFLHGAAGDFCAKHIGQYGMIPDDLILAIPRQLP